MLRKDAVQDTDRLHFYSQFWIDVASGKRDVISGREEGEAEAEDFPDDEFAIPAVAEPVAPAPKAPAKSKKTPEKKVEQPRSITSLADLANIDLLMKSSAEMDTDVAPDIETGPIDDLTFEPAAGAPSRVSDFDAETLDEEDVPEFSLEDEAEDELEDFDDEDEEDDGWGNRRAKPGKQPPQKRRERRDRF